MEEAGMIGFLMRRNIAKTPEGAKALLFALMLINFLVTFFIIYQLVFASSSQSTISQEEYDSLLVQQAKERQQQ